MTELPARVQLLDTAELCIRAAQVVVRQPDDSAAVRLAAAPIIAWAQAGEDPVDAGARRKAVKLVLAGMGRALETAPGTRVQTGEEFVAAAEELRAALADAAGRVPGYEPGQAAHPGTGAGTGIAPGTGAGMKFSGGRLMWLMRNLIVAAFAGDPEARDRLVAGAVRYGRTASQPATTGEYAAALAFLFGHDPRLGTPAPALADWEREFLERQSGTQPEPDRESFPPGWREPPTGPQREFGPDGTVTAYPEPVLPGAGWLEAMDGAPSGTQPEPGRDSFPAGWREPPTGPQRNLGAYPAGNDEDGGGAP